jgi:hypothetical protein
LFVSANYREASVWVFPICFPIAFRFWNIFTFASQAGGHETRKRPSRHRLCLPARSTNSNGMMRRLDLAFDCPNKKIWYARLCVHGHTRRLALGDVARIDLEPTRAAAKRFFAKATLGQDPVKARAEKDIAAKESASRPNPRRHRERFFGTTSHHCTASQSMA